jgi:CRP-like cAMP-binding protein
VARMEPRWPSLDWVACCLGRGKLSPLTKHDVEALAQELGTQHFGTGAVIFKQGAAPASVHIVSRGAIELSRGTGDDRVVFEVLGPGDVFGDVPMLLQMLEPFDARAASDSQVLSIDAQTLLKLLASRPALNQRWLVSMADRMSRLQLRISELLSGGLDAQVAALLINRADCDKVALSQSAIAKLLGAQRSSVNRILRQFETQGIVELAYRSIRICDPVALSEVAVSRLG